VGARSCKGQDHYVRVQFPLPASDFQLELKLMKFSKPMNHEKLYVIAGTEFT
jgi:hypothetical protein